MHSRHARKFFQQLFGKLRRSQLWRRARVRAPLVSGCALDTVLQRLPTQRRLQRNDVRFADRVIVYTQNSRYDLLVVGNDDYMVCGGWFDAEQRSPQRVRINGCTWGGSMIWRDTIAAPGMCIEFNNRVLTSPVRRVLVCRPNAETSSATHPMR